jgi:hypothetical protein
MMAGESFAGPAASEAALGGDLEPSVAVSLLRGPAGPAWAIGLIAGMGGAELYRTVATRTAADLRALESSGWAPSAMWGNDSAVRALSDAMF